MRNLIKSSQSWDSVYSIVQWFADNQDRFSLFHGQGQWNDMDIV
jgi:hypothetical protein